MHSDLSSWEVKALVYEWFRQITDKVPVENLMEMLSAHELEMKFPEQILRNYDDFKKWYQIVTNKFFNQVHEIKAIDVNIKKNEAIVNLVVNWQAQTWEAPAAFSSWSGAYIYQNWLVRRDTGADKVIIVKYAVGQFQPMKGFGRIYL